MLRDTSNPPPDPALRAGAWLRRHLKLVAALTAAGLLGFVVWLVIPREEPSPSITYTDRAYEMLSPTLPQADGPSARADACRGYVQAATALAEQDGITLDTSEATEHCLARLAQIRPSMPVITQPS